MSFIPQSRTEWIGQIKLAVFILALFGYALFLMEAWDTGLGVYHNPRFCWIAGAFALLALVVASKPQRRIALAAFAVAIVVGIYGYRENAIWKEKLKHAGAQISACGLAAEEPVSLRAVSNRVAGRFEPPGSHTT
jgi:hypothetical protein